MALQTSLSVFHSFGCISVLPFGFFVAYSAPSPLESFGKLPAPHPATYCSPSLLQLSWDAALPEPRPPPFSPPGRWAFLQGLAVGCTFPSLEMTSGGHGEG